MLGFCKEELQKGSLGNRIGDERSHLLIGRFHTPYQLWISPARNFQLRGRLGEQGGLPLGNLKESNAEQTLLHSQKWLVYVKSFCSGPYFLWWTVSLPPDVTPLWFCPALPSQAPSVYHPWGVSWEGLPEFVGSFLCFLCASSSLCSYSLSQTTS